MITEGKDRREIYVALITDPKTAGTFKKYSFKEFENRLLNDEKAASMVAERMVQKGIAQDVKSFYDNYMTLPATKAQPAPQPSQPPAVSLAPPQRQSIEQQAAGQATGFVPPMAVQPEQPVFQPFVQFKNEAELQQTAKSPVFKDYSAASAVIADREKQYEDSDVKYLEGEDRMGPTGKFNIIQKFEGDNQGGTIAQFDTEGQMLANTDRRSAAPSGLIMPFKDAETDFAKMSPEQQAQAIAGSTGSELERKKANEKRSGLQKIKDFGKTLGGIATNAYDAILASEKLLGAKQRDLLTFGGAEENLKKVKQQVISSMGKIENEYAQELRDNNIETSLVDVINKGELSKLPEAIGYNVANAIVSGLGAAFTGGYSMFAQTLAQDYKSGVENLAKETNRTPEQVIADGDDAELIPAISATIQGLIEKAQIGLASKAINSKGAYKYIRDLVVKNTGNSKWAKAAGAGLGLGVASLESGAQGAAQEVTSIASEEAAGSDSFNKFYNKLGKTLSSEAGQKRLTESLVGEAIGAGGLIAGGRFGSRVLGERSPSAPPTQLGGIPTIPAPPNAPEFVPPVPPPSGNDGGGVGDPQNIQYTYIEAKGDDIQDESLKNKGYQSEEISPDEYLKETGGYESTFIDQKKVDKIKEKIRNGIPLDPLTLTSKDGSNVGQEGRHRAEAAKQLGIKVIPVVRIDGNAESTQSQTTYETVTPEELQAFQTDPNFATNNPERAAAIADDVVLIQSGQMDINSIDDANYRLMVESAMGAAITQEGAGVDGGGVMGTPTGMAQSPAVLYDEKTADSWLSNALQNFEEKDVRLSKLDELEQIVIADQRLNPQDLEASLKAINKERDILQSNATPELNIISSGLNGGFKAISFDAFDVRADQDVMDEIGKKKSFVKSIEKDGKKYVIVGLALKQGVGARSVGRDGYVFSMVEDNGSLPDNIADVLTENAISNTKNIYPNIQNVGPDSFKPIANATPQSETIVADQAAQNMGTAVNQPLETGAAAVEVGESGRPVVEVEGDQVVEEEGVKPTEISEYGDFLLNELESLFTKKYPKENFDREGIVKGLKQNRGTNTGRMESDVMELIGSYIDPSIRVPAAQALKAQFNKLKEQAEGKAEAPKAGGVGVGGEDARKVMSKEIDSQVSAKENELIEKQKQDIEKAKNDLKAINSGDKSVIDEYVKKSGYKPVTKEVIANNPKSELLKKSEGKYYNSTGASIQVKTAEQIAIDGASKKANSKPTGSKTGTNQYVDAYNAITNFSEGKITAEEAKSIIEKAGLKIPKAVEQSLKEAPKPKAGSVGGEVKDYKGIFNPKKTGISGLDALLKDNGYNYFYKGVSGEVVMMSPDEYLKRVREGLKTKEDANIIEDKKDAINEAINDGNKIDMPFISTKDGKFSQEGRNRAVVARERGEKLIPVFIEKDVSFDDKIAKGQEYINSAIKDGATTKEEVLSKLKEQGLHRDGIRFIDDNFNDKAVEQSLKETPKAKAEEGDSVGVVGDVYKNNPELSKTGTEQEYLDYIESVFPDSKIKDVVYHKTSSKEIEGGKFKISRLGGVYFSFFNVPSGGLLKGLVQKLIKENTIIAVVDVKNPFIVNRNNAKEVVKKIGLTTQDVTKLRKNFDLSTNDAVLGFPNEAKDTGQLDNFPTISFNEKDKKDIIELAVFDPEQIHILGSKSDIEGFKKWKPEQSLKEAPKPKAEKTSPLAPFSTKDKEGQAARAALKESVGPKEYKRLENIAKNGEKILKDLQSRQILKIDCP